MTPLERYAAPHAVGSENNQSGRRFRMPSTYLEHHCRRQLLAFEGASRPSLMQHEPEGSLHKMKPILHAGGDTFRTYCLSARSSRAVISQPCRTVMFLHSLRASNSTCCGRARRRIHDPNGCPHKRSSRSAVA